MLLFRFRLAVPVFSFFLFALFAGLFSDARAQDVTPEMKGEIEQIVRDYIDENPEILLDAIEALRQRDAEQRGNKARSALIEKRDELINSPYSPAVGNLAGDVTIVEFSDYRCPYCKRMALTVRKLMKEDGNIRVVHKEFPILGPISTYAARAALAVWNTTPEKYEAFHYALLATRGDLTEKRILLIADETGLESDALEEAMKSPAGEQEIQRNLKLADELNITGTPSFVIGRELVPGAVSFDDLKAFVATARNR